MSALNFDEIQLGETLYYVARGNVVATGKVVAIKRRSAGKHLICLETTATLELQEFWPEKFFRSSQESWYAVAMFAQRNAGEMMAIAQKAFRQAGIASPEPAPAA